MEACGSAHHWARTLAGLGHQVELLPCTQRGVDRRASPRTGAGRLHQRRPQCAFRRTWPVISGTWPIWGSVLGCAV